MMKVFYYIKKENKEELERIKKLKKRD